MGKTVKDKTGFHDELIDELILWFARQPRKIQLQCTDVDQLAKIVKRAARLKGLMEEGQAKRYDRDLESISEAQDLRLQKIRSSKRKKRYSPKAESIKNHKATIRQLLERGASWPEISIYLQKYSRLKATPSYLRRIYLSMSL